MIIGLNVSNPRPADASTALALLLVFSLIVLISPLTHTAGLRAAVYMPLYVALIGMVFATKQVQLSRVLVVLGMLTLITSLMPAIYHAQIKFVFFSLNIVIAVGLLSLVSRGTVIRAVEISSYLLIALLLLAVASFFFVFLGGQPAGIYVSPEQREITWIWGSLAYLYPTPLGTLARPTGIYDEPGAFSFVICVLAAARHLCGLRRGTTWAMLLLGLFTFSLAHVLYIVFHFLAESRKSRFLPQIAIPVLLAVFLVQQSGAIGAFNEALWSRLAVSSSEGRLIAGDNRTVHLRQDAERIQEASGAEMLFGYRDEYNCCNPLWPLVERGILGSWPYYLVLSMLLAFGLLSRRNVVLIGVALLLMQRPSFQSAGYAFLVALLLVMMLGHQWQNGARRFVGLRIRRLSGDRGSDLDDNGRELHSDGRADT